MKLIPKFLTTLDRYLLINKPLIWRTRIHYLLFYSMVVNAVVAAGTMLIPMSQQNIPVDDWTGFLMLFTFPLLGFAGLYWLYTQFKYKLNGGAFWDKLLTIGIYGFGVFALFFNIIFAHGIISFKIAHTVDKATLQADYDYARADKNFETAKYIELAKAYGLRSEYEKEGSSYYTKHRLLDKIRSVENAQRYFSTESSDFKEFFGFGTVLLLLFAPMLLLLVSFTGFRHIVIVAFAQLLLWMGAAIGAWADTGIIANYCFFAFVLFIGLITMRDKHNNFTEMGHYLLISMMSFLACCLLISTIIESDGNYLATAILSALFLMSYFFLQAGVAWMTSRLKARPR